MIDNPRLDLLVARHGTAVIVALALVGVLALAISGWAVATPHEETTTQEIDTETLETELGTSAVVESDGLWDEGTELTNEPVYLRDATSTLTLAPRTTVPTSDTAVVHDVTLRHEATRDGTVFWDRSEPLLRDQPAVDGDVAASAVEIDLEEIRAEQREVEDQVGDIANVRTVVALQTSYDTGTNADDLVLETELVVTERAAWLDDPTPSVTEPHRETQLVTNTESRSIAFVGFFALLGTVALAGAWVLRQRTPVDEAVAQRAVHEHRYAEWISRGSLPMWVGDHHIALDTLEDVVDVAIDTSNRVVHDTDRGLFAAVTDDVVYYYSDRGRWEQTAWPSMELGASDSDEFDPSEGADDGGGPASGGGSTADARFGDATGDRGAGHPGATDRDVPDAPADLDPDDENAWNQV